MSDEITLTLPRARPFYRIAHLVLGGLAVRLDLTFEHLEDLQLALAGILDRPDEDGEVTVRVAVDGDVLRASVGPFDPTRLERELDRVGEENLSLRRLLETVMDEVDVGEQDGGSWVELRKTVAAAAG
jgi:anti-sigma regulatory factor (Ser/Thr protein kinase)